MQETDQVCGMQVEESSPHAATHQGRRYLFCSADCLREFQADPGRFVTSAPLLEARDVSKRYRLGKVAVTVLSGVNLRIFRGDFAAIIGKSGSGKSTLMHLFGLLDRPTEGSIRIDGTDVGGLPEKEAARIRGERIGFVFQKFHLVPSLTALQNVCLPALFRRDGAASARGKKLLTEVGLGERMLHRPAELSGGEQQRVAIARALINDPDILLADEPTGNLDSKTGREILALLVRLRERGKTLVIVTHDPFIAEQAARIFNIADGRIFRGHEAAHPFVGLNATGRPGHEAAAGHDHDR